jgi:phosphohistidine phosphatase
MRRLILFRHAKAEARAAGGEDIDRPLTARGRRDAAIVSRAMAGAGIAPDLTLLSPSARTLETWRCAEDAFGAAPTQVRDGLYNATPEEVAGEIDVGTEGAVTLVVVGHNPSLQELAAHLLAERAGSAEAVERVASGFPTATAAVLGFDDAGRASLEALFLARDFGGGEE